MTVDGEVAPLVLLAGGVVGAVHLFAPSLHRLFASEAVARSLLAGLSAAYIFVVLLPELNDPHELLGDLVFAIVLAGFVLLYGVEHAARRRDRARGDHGGQRGLYWLRTGIVGVTTMLFVLTIPDHLQDKPTHFALVIGGAALGLAVHSWEVAEDQPLLHQRAGRWVLVVVAAVGAAVDLFLGSAPEVVLDVLVALLAGFLLLRAMLGTHLDPARTRFAPFLTGTAVYLAIFLSRPLHPG